MTIAPVGFGPSNQFRITPLFSRGGQRDHAGYAYQYAHDTGAA